MGVWKNEGNGGERRSLSFYLFKLYKKLIKSFLLYDITISYESKYPI